MIQLTTKTAQRLYTLKFNPKDMLDEAGIFEIINFKNEQNEKLHELAKKFSFNNEEVAKEFLKWTINLIQEIEMVEKGK